MQSWCNLGAIFEDNHLPWLVRALIQSNDLYITRGCKINSKSCLVQAQIRHKPCTAPNNYLPGYPWCWCISEPHRQVARLVTHKRSVLLAFGTFCGCYLDNASSVIHSSQSTVHSKAHSLGSTNARLPEGVLWSILGH